MREGNGLPLSKKGGKGPLVSSFVLPAQGGKRGVSKPGKRSAGGEGGGGKTGAQRGKEMEEGPWLRSAESTTGHITR